MKKNLFVYDLTLSQREYNVNKIYYNFTYKF